MNDFKKTGSKLIEELSTVQGTASGRTRPASGGPSGPGSSGGDGPKPDIPDELASKWQRAVDRLASQSKVRAVLVVRFDPPQVEVFISSRARDNPYRKGERSDLRSGLYCEWILKNRTQLLVSDARGDSLWGQKPDARRGMIWHLGLPVQWPDGELFGAICMFDSILSTSSTPTTTPSRWRIPQPGGSGRWEKTQPATRSRTTVRNPAVPRATCVLLKRSNEPADRSQRTCASRCRTRAAE